jgi:hypothetical protein
MEKGPAPSNQVQIKGNIVNDETTQRLGSGQRTMTKSFLQFSCIISILKAFDLLSGIWILGYVRN